MSTEYQSHRMQTPAENIFSELDRRDRWNFVLWKALFYHTM